MMGSPLIAGCRRHAILARIVALAVVLYCERRARSDSVLAGGAKVVASASFLAAALALGAFDHFYGQTLFIIQ